MNHFGEPNSFFDFFQEIPLFARIFIGLLFFIVIGGFVFIIIKGLSTWISNNASAIVQKKCNVIDKRTEVWGGSGDSSTSTNYYITFEFEDHTRIYLRDKDFGLISIGDQGELRYQGTRFKEFIRSQQNSL
ncbi:DUF2500 domain-containing protein [Paenibacillus yonginensis]|uniref:DUF2500 domain-containing protein n=1 Tax=Paenibacillus yonginensis TaxID=1462996 RepID=UPI0009F3A69F|nr:DUF2500 domain-containing protein [Paenibacillus yonginensis]